MWGRDYLNSIYEFELSRWSLWKAVKYFFAHEKGVSNQLSSMLWGGRHKAASMECSYALKGVFKCGLCNRTVPTSLLYEFNCELSCINSIPRQWDLAIMNVVVISNVYQRIFTRESTRCWKMRPIYYWQKLRNPILRYEVWRRPKEQGNSILCSRTHKSESRY